jgi:hypothetical protein
MFWLGVTHPAGWRAESHTASADLCAHRGDRCPHGHRPVAGPVSPGFGTGSGHTKQRRAQLRPLPLTRSRAAETACYLAAGTPRYARRSHPAHRCPSSATAGGLACGDRRAMRRHHPRS